MRHPGFAPEHPRPTNLVLSYGVMPGQVAADLEMYDRILPWETQAEPLDPEAPTLHVNSITDDEITINGVRLLFDASNERYTVNLLLGQSVLPGTRHELHRMLDFWDKIASNYRKSNWLESVRATIERLQRASCQQLIEVEDGVEYIVRPNIVIEKPRLLTTPEIVEEPQAATVDVQPVGPQQISVELLEIDRATTPYERESDSDRARAIAAICDKYKNHIDVLEAPSRYMVGNDTATAGRRQCAKTILLSSKEVDGFFDDIERGLVELHQFGGPSALESFPKDYAPESLLNLTKAFNVLVVFRPLVMHLASQRSLEGGLQLTDYVQEGFIAMMDAIACFEVGGKYNFPGFARTHIRYHLALIQGHSRPFSITKHALEDISRIQKIGRDFHREHLRPPTPSELSTLTGHTPSRLAELLQAASYALPSLEAPLPGVASSEEGVLTLRSQLHAMPLQESSTHVRPAQKEMITAIFSSDDKISDNTRFMIGLRFGLDPSYMPNLAFTRADGNQLSYGEAYSVILDLGHTEKGILAISRITGEDCQSIRGRIRKAILRLRKSEQSSRAICSASSGTDEVSQEVAQQS